MALAAKYLIVALLALGALASVLSVAFGPASASIPHPGFRDDED